MAVVTKWVKDYNWFKVGDAGVKIPSLSFDPSCVWEWSLGEPAEGESGHEYTSYTTYTNWTPVDDLYFRKRPRDFKDLPDPATWYKIDE